MSAGQNALLRHDPVQHPLPQPLVDVRKEFSICVEKMGGIVTDVQLAGRPANAANADFVFPGDGVVVELKCLEVDWAKELAVRAPALTEEWMLRGKIPPRSGTVNLSDLPLPLVREILAPFRKRLQQNLLAKANKQIKRTCLDMGRPTDKGLLIVFNDGNYAMEPDMMAHLIMPTLHTGEYSAINTVIYTGVNVQVEAAPPFHRAGFWMPWSVRNREPVSTTLLHRLAETWLSHLSGAIGMPVAELAPSATIESMRFSPEARP